MVEYLAYEWCEIYEAMSNRTTNIVRFQCGTFEYVYYDYASLETTGRARVPVTEPWSRTWLSTSVGRMPFPHSRS